MMRQFLAILALAASAAAAPPAPPPIMWVNDVKPGMKGFGLTTFHGTTPERFEVEVVGVLRHFLPKQDLVLIRMDHPILRHAGIVAGMSGSPVYVDGKLVGAVAYGFPFAKDQ